jgi:hypothetical protein
MTACPFDDDLFDAEIIVRRWGGGEFDARKLGRLLGAPTDEGGRQKVTRRLAKGTIPPAAFPSKRGSLHPGESDPTRSQAARWSQEQVIDIVADLLRTGASVCVIKPE